MPARRYAASAQAGPSGTPDYSAAQRIYEEAVEVFPQGELLPIACTCQHRSVMSTAAAHQVAVHGCLAPSCPAAISLHRSREFCGVSQAATRGTRWQCWQRLQATQRGQRPATADLWPAHSPMRWPRCGLATLPGSSCCLGAITGHDQRQLLTHKQRSAQEHRGLQKSAPLRVALLKPALQALQLHCPRMLYVSEILPDLAPWCRTTWASCSSTT